MAGRWSFHGILCLLVLLFLVCAEPGFGCIERERQALLDFKHRVVDYYGVLSSWGEENLNKNCCSWRGILCSNQSGRVIMLRLPAPPNEEYNLIGGDYQSLRGEISSSLVELEHLTHLDLSHNDFEGKQIPAFLGSFTRMEYLNLSYTEFSGSIPAQLGNLSNLVYLDLRRNEGLDSGNLEWVSHLSSLRHLGMSSLDLTKAINWPQVINKLPSLIHLELDSCGLPPTNPSLFNGNSSIPPLEFLDLSGNYLITSSIYSWLFDFSATLFHLDLSFCRLNGFIPGAFGNMSSLEYLGLSDNQFDGEIPNALEHMESLAHLDLSSNQLRGSMPDTIGKMVLLSHLDLSHNQLQSSIPEAIGNMVSLLHLDLSYNQLQGSIPDAIGKMVLLSHLDLSINLLQGNIPDTIGNLVSLKELSLSYNHLQGEIPKSLTNLCNLQTLKLASNNLIGLLPHDFLSCTNGSLRALSLSENQFSGSVPHLIGFSSLTELRLDYNKFNGSLPERFGQNLQTLDISSNSFEGIISEAHLFNLSQCHI